MSLTSSIRRVAAVLAAALVASVSLAAGNVRIDASSVPFSTSTAPTSVGVDLAWQDGDLVLLLSSSGSGALPNALLTQAGTLPTNALGRIIAEEAIVRSDGPEQVPGGVTLVHGSSSYDRLDDLVSAYAQRLQALGFQVGELGQRSFDFSMGGVSYRAVFSAVSDGTVVYLGL